MPHATNTMRHERLAIAGRKPRLPTVTNRRTMDLVWLVALLPVVVMTGGAHMAFWGNLVLLIVTVLFWQFLFALARRRSVDMASALAALGLAVLLPTDTPVMMTILAASFGSVLAELIFGGRGWAFLNPVVVAVAFLLFSTPTLSGAQVQIPVFAVVPGAVVLVLTGLVSWQIPMAALVTSGATAVLRDLPLQSVLIDGSALFVLVFLIADPVASAHTRIGRWAYGALVGVLMVILLPASGAITLQALCFAALLGAIFAPLIDAGIMAFATAQRARHG